MSIQMRRSQTVKVRDVAREAGVAVGTVSRVLNDHPTVTRELRVRVEKAMADLGYEVDVTAQSMRAGRSRLVACAIRDFDIPRFALFIKEAEAVLREAGYTLLLASTTNRPDVEVSLLRAFRRRRVDGVMMTLSDEEHRDVRMALSGIQLHGYTDEVQLARLREVSASVLTVTPYRWIHPTVQDRLPKLINAACRCDGRNAISSASVGTLPVQGAMVNDERWKTAGPCSRTSFSISAPVPAG